MRPPVAWPARAAAWPRAPLAPGRARAPFSCTAPAEYEAVLELLRRAAATTWPETPTSHARLIRGCGVVAPRGADASGRVLSLVNPAQLEPPADAAGRRRRRRPPRGNALFPELAAALFALEAAVAPGRAPSARCFVGASADYAPHVLPGAGAAPCLVLGLGEYEGGELVVEGEPHCVRRTAHEFDGGRRTHWTAPASGERFGLTWCTPARSSAAATAAAAAASARRYAPPLRYRVGSTDANVLAEVLGGPGRAPAYAGPPAGDPRWPGYDFSPKGMHALDVGAHIGAFTRWALAEGAAHVTAFEPEPANAALLRANTEGCGARVTVVEAAVSARAGATASLVLGKARSDGAENTWRHALAEYCHYKPDAGGELRSVPVAATPLFGEGGALTPSVSFVKLDCEGAELELLADYAPGAWLGVRRLVFEWSFTKERRLDRFVGAVRRLEAEGFDVWYEGKGNWDEHLDRWPWPSDALVFAARDPDGGPP